MDSSVIASVGYDADRRILDVEFHHGRAVYRYFDVPQDVHQRLRDADSMGRFFVKHIRNEFRCERIDP